MWILGLLLTLPAQAEDCDASSLSRHCALRVASESAAAFSALAECDAAVQSVKQRMPSEI